MTDAERYAAGWENCPDHLKAISLAPDDRGAVIQSICEARSLDRNRLGCLPPYYGLSKDGIAWAVGLAIDRVQGKAS